ncbi:MAG: hypothetical protein H0X72_16340 [Acidobacteria bacterium]|nr:hypothetical protein [Acidobacteriota bacterium]
MNAPDLLSDNWEIRFSEVFMKKILLAVIFVTVFSSVGANAQQVFIPQPPAPVYIPQLDPVWMHVQRQVTANMVNNPPPKGAAKNSKTTAKAAVDYTVFNQRQENYLPKLLSQTGKGNAAEQRQAEQFYSAQIEMYERTAAYYKYPANDVAFALEYFISNNYEIYYDLVTVPVEKDPWAKRAKNGFERLALLNTKKSQKITPDQDRTMYFQFKEMLSAKPEFRKMTDEDKQKMTETLAITCGVVYEGYMKAIEDEDEQLIKQAHEAAKENLEKLLGVTIDKIKINYAGLQLQ